MHEVAGSKVSTVMEYIEAAQRFEENAAGLVIEKMPEQNITVNNKVWASMKFFKQRLSIFSEVKKHLWIPTILMTDTTSI